MWDWRYIEPAQKHRSNSRPTINVDNSSGVALDDMRAATAGVAAQLGPVWMVREGENPKRAGNRRPMPGRVCCKLFDGSYVKGDAGPDAAADTPDRDHNELITLHTGKFGWRNRSRNIDSV